MKLRVINGGTYPGNRKVLPALLRGEDVPWEKRGMVEVRPGDLIDSDELDPRVVRSLMDNGVVEEVVDGG